MQRNCKGLHNKMKKRGTKNKPKEKRERGQLGRSFIKLDWDQIDALCALHCNQAEIAGVLKINIDTLCNHAKKKFGITFAEYLKQGRQVGNLGLRRRMWKTAENSVAMQIFLAKNWLGMSDDPAQTDDEGTRQNKLVLKIITGSTLPPEDSEQESDPVI